MLLVALTVGVHVDLNFDLPPRSSYHLKAFKTGSSFHWRLYDKSTNPATEVFATGTTTTSTDPQTIIVPVVIPKK